MEENDAVNHYSLYIFVLNNNKDNNKDYEESIRSKTRIKPLD